MICAGIDAGSRSIKAVLFDTEACRVLASGIIDQGVEQQELAERVYLRVLENAGLQPSQISAVAATGYGRKAVRFANTTITEITCHARGVHHLAPTASTIIEIGGQDSKIIRVEGRGRVRDFSMNDRCAAGTGRFLEMLSSRLGMDWEQLAELGRQSQSPAAISSTCVVFAETEIIGLLAQGTRVADVVAGVQQSIAGRVSSLAGCAVAPPVYFTGGVALQSGMVRALENCLGCSVNVVSKPQYTGALGAAILADASSQ